MRCARAQRWLRENPPEAFDTAPEAMREHVAGCAECQVVRRRQARLTALLAGLPEPEPLVGGRQRLLARLPARRGARPLVARLAAGGLAVALVAVLLVAQRPAPPVEVAAAGDEGGTLVQQHFTLASFEPLADPTALSAAGALSLRREMQQRSGGN